MYRRNESNEDIVSKERKTCCARIHTPQNGMHEECGTRNKRQETHQRMHGNKKLRKAHRCWRNQIATVVPCKIAAVHHTSAEHLHPTLYTQTRKHTRKHASTQAPKHAKGHESTNVQIHTHTHTHKRSSSKSKKTLEGC